MKSQKSRQSTLLRPLVTVAVLAILLSFSLKSSTAAGPSISLEQFLSEVEGGNPELKAAKEASEGAKLRSKEANMKLFAPRLEAKAQWVSDQRKSAFLVYDSFKNNIFDVSVSQQTNYGLVGTVSYGLVQTGYIGLGLPIYYYGSPKVELSFDLWQNFLGRDIRAQEVLAESGILASRYHQSFAAKAARAEAEAAYIQLAAARAVHTVYLNSSQRAKEIYNWNSRRFRLNLGEDSDLFQAEANLQATELALQSSMDQVRAAARAFNKARGIDSDVVNETLTLPETKNASTPVRAEIRDDVRAAREQTRSAAAQAEIGKEGTKPTLQVFAGYALNSQEENSGTAFSKSFNNQDPTKMVGIRLSTPLSFSSREIRSGYEKERIAAEMTADQKLFHQEVEWKDLVSRLSEAKSRLTVAEKLAAIQQKKALNERKRLSRGRTTTYQSLIFETDYNQAESQRIQAQSEVLLLLARMKTFGG
jgi:outer membrane protein TolC